jgi:predicted RNA-binding protein YlqC (UPF0109 family)
MGQLAIYDRSKTMSHPTFGIADDAHKLSQEAGQSVNGHLEPRCRVCRNNVLRQKVNGLLATGSSYAMIVRALEDDNSKLDARDRVTIDSIRNHTMRHFPVQNTAKATYREILERRAKEANVDFANGIATALTPISYLETVVVKAYKTLVDSDTKVDVNTGLAAAVKLQAYIDARSGQADIAEVFVKQNRIIEAMREFIPANDLPAFLARLDGITGSAVAAEVEEFDPDIGDDDDDEI